MRLGSPIDERIFKPFDVSLVEAVVCSREDNRSIPKIFVLIVRFNSVSDYVSLANINCRQIVVHPFFVPAENIDPCS